MERTTIKHLEGLTKQINLLTGNKLTEYTKDGDKFTANIGNYHLSGAYGGYALHQMANESGGVHDVFRRGHMPKSELYNLMAAFIEGINLNKGM